MSSRLAHHAVETLIQETIATRVSQYALEVLTDHPTASPSTPTGAGISQYALEALVQEAVSVRVGHIAVEVLFIDGNLPPPTGGGGGTHMWGWAD